MSFVSEFEVSAEPRDFIEWLSEEEQWDRLDQEQTEDETWAKSAYTRLSTGLMARGA